MASLVHGAAAGRAIAAKPIAAAFVAGCWWWASTGRGQMDRCWAHMDDPDFYNRYWNLLLKYSCCAEWLKLLFEVFYHLTFFWGGKYRKPSNKISSLHLSIHPSIPWRLPKLKVSSRRSMGFGPRSVAFWIPKKPWSWGQTSVTVAYIRSGH